MGGLREMDILNPFHTTGLLLYPLKTSVNYRFFNVFGGYREREQLQEMG